MSREIFDRSHSWSEYNNMIYYKKEGKGNGHRVISGRIMDKKNTNEGKHTAYVLLYINRQFVFIVWPIYRWFGVCQ